MRQPESLLQFFGAYFHQDWGVESPDWQGVVAMFIHDSSAQDIAAVAAGVEHLARGASSEAELERILLNELGCYYTRSEEHTSELQSLMRISYAVFCLKNKTKQQNATHTLH